MLLWRTIIIYLSAGEFPLKTAQQTGAGRQRSISQAARRLSMRGGLARPTQSAYRGGQVALRKVEGNTAGNVLDTIVRQCTAQRIRGRGGYRMTAQVGG